MNPTTPKKNPFNRKVLSVCVAAATLASINSHAQQTEADEILVTGIRAAQERAIDVKRNSAEVVDSISAEDIGKLPDSTIADSLQRVTGIQIQRSAGQGGVVSIRGQREVLTTLNGELFLSPDNILDSQANYASIPSSLISGSNVSKSMNAKQLEGGIGGTVDLLTRRSLKMDEGFSGSARLQVDEGNIVKKVDPEVSGLIGYKANDTFATSLSFAWANQNLSDNSVKTKAADDRIGESWGANYHDLNGDGKKDLDALLMWNWDGPELYNNITERERIGLNYNLNAAIGDAFELNVDSFYNSLDNKARGNEMQPGEGTNWDRGNFTALYGLRPTTGVGKPLGKSLDAKYYSTGWTANMYGGMRAGLHSDYNNAVAFNNSVELKMDTGGAFTGSVRYVTSKAYKDNSSLNLVQKASSPGGNDGIAYNAEGDKRVVNPGWIEGFYPVTFKMGSEKASLMFDPQLVNAMKAKEAWYLHSGWLEGDRSDANLDVIRADGNYKFADSGITSVDFGIRRSEREAKKNAFHYFLDTGVNATDPKTGKSYEMLVKWHEAGYVADPSKGGVIGSYYVLDKNGNKVGVNTFDSFVPFAVQLSDPQVQKYLHNVTDLGAAVDGFNGVIPMIDPNKIGDHLKFMNSLYKADHQKIQRPDQSYVIDEARDSLYFNFNFDSQLTDDISFAGNAGVRRVTDTLTVTRHKTDGNSLAPNILAGTDPNHSAYVDLGLTHEVVEHSHFLPSLNTNFRFGDEYKIKFSYDERTSLQSLNDFGEGSSTSYSSNNTDPDTGTIFQRISEYKKGGNPNLQPWKASVINLAGEWYPTESSLLGLTAFYMDIGGFVDTKTTLDPTYPDSDGKVRNGAKVTEKINGKNATVSGLEFSYQQSFDFLPSFLSHTGMTWNYTYSPSTKDGKKFATDGSDIPFNSTAKSQSNLVLWYDDKTFEFRVAANYLGKKYDGQYSNWTVSPLNDVPAGYEAGLDKWEKSTLYVDLSSTYHINDNLDASLNVQNLTKQGSQKYIHWSDFISESYVFEQRITLGLNAKF
jgi:iron complex outermembrane recepter protein